MSDPWTDEKIEKLTELWLAGVSAGKIANKFNMTRSAVMGKVSRLKLARGDAEKAPEREPDADPAPVVEAVPEPVPEPPQLVAPVPTVVPGKTRKGGAKRLPLPRDHVPAPVLQFQPRPVHKRPAGPQRRLELLDLEPHECRFAISDMHAAVHLFCGDPRALGSSYCARHHALAYTSSRAEPQPVLKTGSSQGRVFA